MFHNHAIFHHDPDDDTHPASAQPNEEGNNETGQGVNIELDTEHKNEDPHSLPSGPPPESNIRPAATLPSFPAVNREESSSVNPSDPPTITWDQYTPTSTPVGSWGDPHYQPTPHPRYLSRYCSICEKLMGTLNPFKMLTCHDCQRGIDDSLKLSQDTVKHNVNTKKDDEE
jgi:hypothetical protein